MSHFTSLNLLRKTKIISLTIDVIGRVAMVIQSLKSVELPLHGASTTL